MEKGIWMKLWGSNNGISETDKYAAVTNCLIEEYKDAIIQRGVQIIKVANHKTGAYGTAKLTK